MKKLPYLLALSGLISAPVFAADAAPAEPASPHTFAYNVGVTTDYVFRGITQTQHKPALSGGIDYSHSSGLYLGTWVSNQSWVKTGGSAAPGDAFKTGSDLEVDLYGGYKGTLPADVGYDIGVIHYYYPGSRGSAATAGLPTPDTTEVYIAGSWKIVSLKYSHVVSDYFIGWGSTAAGSEYKTRGSNYVDLTVSPDLGNGWGLVAHVGHQIVKHNDLNSASYSDWKLGVTKDVGFGSVALAYTDTDAKKVAYGDWDGKNVGKGVLALSFTKTF
jgi:uncharacterized protein (TIGR02001 family)